MRYRSLGLRPSLPRRTLEYLERGAPEGTRNAELFDAACQFRDAGISPDESEARLIERAVADGLGEAESRAAIRSAFAHAPRQPVLPGHPGSGATYPRQAPASAGHAPDQPVRGPRFTPSPLPLPEPVEGGFLRLLDACFRPEEFVAIAPATEDDEGNIVPKRGVTLTAKQWRKRVESKGGIDKCFTTPLGLFVRINPMREGGAKNDDVTSYRHVLVEFDQNARGERIPKDVQFGAIVSSGLPVTAVIDSGNKSIHAWVRVDAPDAGEYRRRVDIIWDLFEGLNLDKQNKNPSRLSRCPDGWRTVDGERRQQRLLALNTGTESWTEWETENAPDGLPKIVAGSEFMTTPRPEPPQLIAGVLHQGCKMIIGGASKARKSWSLIDMMLAVSSGGPWWSFATQQGRALYINFELPDFAFQHRLKAIAAAKGITDYSGFDLWNLRGYATDFSVLIPKILSRIKDGRYALIVLDPIYKGLGKRDENKAGDIASLCNEIEQLAVQSGAAVVFGAHYSKGNQAGKEAIDRIGGSGVFARDPDVILTMTPHEEKDAYVVDLTLRALPQVEPFVVRWQGVMFGRDDTADPTRIRKPGKAAKAPAAASYRRGSVAERYRPLFERMPPFAHGRRQDGESAVIRHIRETLETIGEACDSAKARRVFDSLRHRAYRLIVFVGDHWQGCKFAGSGGQS